jgi:hypothetical protein
MLVRDAVGHSQLWLFPTTPPCDPWLLTQPPVNNWVFSLSLDSIVDMALHLALSLEGPTGLLDASRA